MRSLKTLRSDEQGIALVMALLMVLAVSVVTGSLVMVARSEALSSTSYTSMSQVRYGAESGVHAAANYFLNTYVPELDGESPELYAHWLEQILLTNLMINPVNAAGVNPPCFTYQERTFSGTTYVIGVAIMTTVRSQQRDQNTGDFQRVTKALLNVAPRNVVAVWLNASLGNTNRVQPLPPSVVQLLP